METPTGSGDVRTLRFGDVELDWTKMPWLLVADRDRVFTKLFDVDLDPVGGPVTTTTLSIGGLPNSYVVLEELSLNPADSFSVMNARIETFIDASPLARWKQIEKTVSPGEPWEGEQWSDRLVVIPPDRVWNLRFTNTSNLGRIVYEGLVKGWISRKQN